MSILGWEEWALISGLLSAFLGVLSTLTLMKGTAAPPWKIQSWGGASADEIAFQKTAATWRAWGFSLLGFAFAAGAFATVASYLA
jgi:hypothetical protein